VPWIQSSGRGLLAASLMGGLMPSALAQPAPSSAPVSPSSLKEGPQPQSIVLARPLQDSVPNFLNELDTYFMPDELVTSIEDRYHMKLRDFSMKQGYLLHTRDARLQRTYLGTPLEEQAMRFEMAQSMSRYMLLRGLPKYLSSKKETRFIGESYEQAVSFAKNVGRIEIQSKDESWKFGSGINPFTSKAWAKYSNSTSTFELYNYFNRPDSLGIVTYIQHGRYVPMAQYYVFKNAFETGFRVKFSPNLDSDLKTFFPFSKPGVLDHAVTKVSTSYRF
jgi:hypothetical protein